MALSPAQIAQYHEHGYVVLGSILDAAGLDIMRGEEARFRAKPMAIDQDRPGQRTIFRSQPGDSSARVRELSTHGAHLDAVRNLVGPDLLFMYNQFVTQRTQKSGTDCPSGGPTSSARSAAASTWQQP